MTALRPVGLQSSESIRGEYLVSTSERVTRDTVSRPGQRLAATTINGEVIGVGLALLSIGYGRPSSLLPVDAQDIVRVFGEYLLAN